MASPEYEVHEAQLQFWIDVGDVNGIGGLANVKAQYPFPSRELYQDWLSENGWTLDDSAGRYRNSELPHLALYVRQVHEFRFEKWL